jgi:copper chaperone
MTTDKTTYRVTGMTCGGCSRSLSSAIQRAAPGLSATVSHEESTVVVEGSHDPAVIARAVADAGFDFGGPVT